MIVSQTLWFAAISEEELADEIRDLLRIPDPTVAPLVGPGEVGVGKVGVGEVDVRVTTRAITREEAEKKMEPVVQKIVSRLSGYYLGGEHE
jgi:molybdopterin-biosynthesis enzyme MoeA-like protein